MVETVFAKSFGSRENADAAAFMTLFSATPNSSPP